MEINIRWCGGDSSDSSDSTFKLDWPGLLLLTRKNKPPEDQGREPFEEKKEFMSMSSDGKHDLRMVMDKEAGQCR